MNQSLESGVAEQGMAVRPASPGTDVRASIVIEAEWPRILNALTVPEYLDVWLTMPGVERVECHAEHKTPGGFRIDIFAANALRQAIHGDCIRSKPDEISYLWKLDHAENGKRSLVKLRLRGGRKRCALHLKHHGLLDQKERDWYSAMWQKSLDKLRAVMEKRVPGN